jgi:hypothetical protein
VNFIVQKALSYVGKRLTESSTWAGIVAFATGAIGWNASPDLQAAIAQVGMALVGALLVFVKERKGANPANAPLPPPGTAPVVVPTDDNRTTAVVVPDKPAASVELQVQPKPTVGQPTPALPTRRSIRPDYDP